ncbi:hypothetical protein DFQ27_009566 [Actinomortierella ambigua]|uniref:Uncharacterized protein n=1 Tax=Actinomortierella ambigua TaxID=1343610 RepID=A0A9P6PQQ2_9FUNG|nr:hypothetical protein DFQ27_009566 [Actinomortierella ambigua]
MGTDAASELRVASSSHDGVGKEDNGNPQGNVGVVMALSPRHKWTELVSKVENYVQFIWGEIVILKGTAVYVLKRKLTKR